MTKKEYKRKSAMLVKLLAYQHWDNYARNLISDLLNHISKYPKPKVRLKQYGKGIR